MTYRPTGSDPDDKDTHSSNRKSVCWYDKEHSFRHHQVDMRFQIEVPWASWKKTWMETVRQSPTLVCMYVLCCELLLSIQLECFRLEMIDLSSGVFIC